MFSFSSPRRDKRGNEEGDKLKEFGSRRDVQRADDQEQTTQSSCIPKEISPSLAQQTDLVQQLAKKVKFLRANWALIALVKFCFLYSDTVKAV